MRVVVAGATGYIGAKTCELLARNGIEVVELSRPDFETKLEKLTQVDAVIYTVSLNHTDCDIDIQKTADTNVVLTWKLLDRCARAGVKKFLYLSVQQVYGRGCTGKVTETSPVRPNNFYGLTHTLSESILEYYARQNNFVGITCRISNVYGPPAFESEKCWNYALNQICRMAIEKGRIQLAGDGKAERDFIHIDDVAAALVHLIQNNQLQSGLHSFHLGTHETYSILEVASLVSRIFTREFQAPLPIYLGDGKPAQSCERAFHSFQYTNARLRETGFTPSKSLANGIRELLQYCEQSFRAPQLKAA